MPSTGGALVRGAFVTQVTEWTVMLEGRSVGDESNPSPLSLS